MENITYGVKAFRKTADDKLVTGGIGESKYTEWEIGKIYTLNNNLPLELCGNGFHFYRKNDACFGTALFDNETVFFTVKVFGEVLSDTEKCVCRSLMVEKEFVPQLDGNWNSGYRNSGNQNSGNRNSGYQNSGNWNSGNQNGGNRNSGDWNSGNWNSGYFNSDTPATIRVFNKDCPIEVWKSAAKPNFIRFEISDGETYKDAFRRSWRETSPEDRTLVEKLPNFDWNIFTEISGIEKEDL